MLLSTLRANHCTDVENITQTGVISETADGEGEVPHLTAVEESRQKESELGSNVPSDIASERSHKASVSRAVHLDSLGVARLDRFTLVRIFRDLLSTRIGYYMSESGGSLSLEQAIDAAIRKVDKQQVTEIYEKLLTSHADSVTFSDLHKLWEHSPEQAEIIWVQMKEECRLEFETGHLATMVFRKAGWMREAYERAKFLAVRDSFLSEYQPEGGIEIALVDVIAQSYFLYLHWTKESVTRTKTDVRRQTDEYRSWEAFKRETGREEMWYPGKWELPYATELECQEQAVKMADHFSRLFQRSVKCLDNHRLAKAKWKRLSA